MCSLKTRPQNIECKFGYVERSTVLLKPNAANILLFNFSEQTLVQHGLITIAIDCNGLSLLICEENGPIIPLDQNPHQTVTRFGCDNFACLHTRQDQNGLHLKRCLFFLKSASSVSRSLAHLAKHIYKHIRSAEG